MKIFKATWAFISGVIILVLVDTHFGSYTKLVNDTHLICLLLAFVICLLLQIAYLLENISDNMKE